MFKLFIFIIAVVFSIALAIEYVYEKHLWNAGICKKCNKEWKCVGGTAFECGCKQKHFTYDWIVKN